MFEYSWMLVFVATNGLLAVGEMDTKEECASAAAQMEKVGTELSSPLNSSIDFWFL